MGNKTSSAGAGAELGKTDLVRIIAVPSPDFYEKTSNMKSFPRQMVY